jgi:hypothetical protein
MVTEPVSDGEAFGVLVSLRERHSAKGSTESRRSWASEICVSKWPPPEGS